MTKGHVEGKVMVAFKPEADLSEIEKVLGQYTHEKVFKKGEFDSLNGRENKVLDRLYSLTVPAGTEADVINGLQDQYGLLVEYVHQPAKRGIRR